MQMMGQMERKHPRSWEELQSKSHSLPPAASQYTPVAVAKQSVI